MNISKQHRASVAMLAAWVMAGVSPVWAADAVLVEGQGVAITARDIQADALRMPPEMRSIVLARPETVQQIASNLYARRAMAAMAEKEGLAQDPTVKAALQVARDKVLSDAHMEALARKSAIGDAEAERLAQSMYKARPERFKGAEQVHVRHILIAAAEPNAQQEAEKLLAEIKAGADFAKLAQERSADKGSAAKGGDLGMFERGRMVGPFEAAAFNLKNPGDLSEVVKTEFGYHILRLEGRQAAKPQTFEQVKADLMREVREKIAHEARVAEANTLQQAMKVHTEAIQSFTAEKQKPAAQ